MKVLFLLPTLDFGRDGIADYTDRLASQCEFAGHQTRLVALGRNNWMNGARALKAAIKNAKREIHDFSPDVLSWQFDGRIFHPQSIFPPSVVPRFSRCGGKIHLMAHETWEGDEEGAKIKRRIKGHLQRRSVIRAMKLIDPDIVHTSNDLYANHLKECGLQPSILPLFSNVPVTASVEAETDYGKHWQFVFFGNFRDQWNPAPFLEILRSCGHPVRIHHVGRNSQPEVLKLLRNSCRGWTEFIEHGPLPEEDISHLLLRCHFAVSSYNLLHLRKSGIYAAFSDHGLPVIAPREDAAKTRSGFSPPMPEGVIALSDLPEALYRSKRFPLKDTLKVSSSRFLKEIRAETPIR